MARNDPDFNERKETSAKAKQALIEKMKAKAAAGTPGLADRQAQRRLVSEARDVRRAQRKEELAAAAAREAADLAAAATREAADLAAAQRALETERALQAAETEKAAAEALVLKAEQKAARDARYAKRKGR